MIQRIQTIYLLLAFACGVLAIFFPIFFATVSTDTMVFDFRFGAYGIVTDGAPGVHVSATQIPLYLVFVFLSLMTLAAIFLYKNRKRQMIICRIGLVLHVLVAAGIYAFYYVGRSYLAEASMIPVGETATIKLGMMAGFYFFISTIPLLILAIRGIKRDENLVKSLDRLR